MDTSIKNRHSKALSRIRKLFPNYLKVEYMNGVVLVNVPCTIAKEKIENIGYGSFIGQNTIIFNILIEDLKAESAPLKGFSTVTYNRVEYMVDKIVTNVLNNSIHLYCKVHKRGNN